MRQRHATGSRIAEATRRTKVVDVRELREGGSHTVYWNPDNHQVSTVPRHTEIVNQLAWKICKDLGIPKI